VGFIDDLIDGIKQQQNPFTTIKKAFSDLGTRPIDDATKAPLGQYSVPTIIFFILIGRSFSSPLLSPPWPRRSTTPWHACSTSRRRVARLPARFRPLDSA